MSGNITKTVCLHELSACPVTFTKFNFLDITDLLEQKSFIESVSLA